MPKNVQEPPEKTTLSPTRTRRPRLLAQRCSSTNTKYNTAYSVFVYEGKRF